MVSYVLMFSYKTTHLLLCCRQFQSAIAKVRHRKGANPNPKLNPNPNTKPNPNPNPGGPLRWRAAPVVAMGQHMMIKMMVVSVVRW